MPYREERQRSTGVRFDVTEVGRHYPPALGGTGTERLAAPLNHRVPRLLWVFPNEGRGKQPDAEPRQHPLHGTIRRYELSSQDAARQKPSGACDEPAEGSVGLHVAKASCTDHTRW